MGENNAIASGPTQLHQPGDESGPGVAEAESLKAGTFAGDYKVLRHLGSGAMGDVYEGEHPVIGKRVAIKVIKRKLASSEDAAERFVREARAVNQVSHPNVADVFSFGRLADGRLFLVMDYLEGESLGARLRRSGAYNVDEFLRVITPVCEALAAAHSKGVIHRDLKPDNVFLAETEQGREQVYVLDFGIAKILNDVSGDTSGGTLTGEGVWMGTPAYMSPEQWTADGASPRSDIYALGTMAFEMLTGAVPYQANSVPAIMEKHFHADVPLLTTSEGVLLPDGVSTAIGRAMAKKPDDRFHTAMEFLEAVRLGAHNAHNGSVRNSRQHKAAVPAALDHAEHSISRPLMWAGLGGIGVLALGALVLFAAKGLQGGDKSVAKPVAASDATKLRVPIITHPKGARIVRNGDHVGSSPFMLEAAVNELIRVRLTKPGYAPIVREVTATEGARLDATLPPVTGFKGVWRLPKGELRGFQRRGSQVAGFSLATASSKGTFLRFFEFLPSEGDSVTFAATEQHVEEKAPNEPSCRIPLRAEYRFHPARNYLELRRERVQYQLVSGRCVVEKKAWAKFKKVTRVAAATASDGMWATSTAGAGPIEITTAVAKGSKARPKSQPKAQRAPARTKAVKPNQAKNTKAEVELDNRMEGVNGDDRAAVKASQNVAPTLKKRPIRSNRAATSRPGTPQQGSAATRGTPPSDQNRRRKKAN